MQIRFIEILGIKKHNEANEKYAKIGEELQGGSTLVGVLNLPTQQPKESLFLFCYNTFY